VTISPSGTRILVQSDWGAGTPGAGVVADPDAIVDTYVIELPAYSAATPNTYAAWRTANFTGADLTDDAISGPAADPEGSGLNNYARYAFALPARGPVAPPVKFTPFTTSFGETILGLAFPVRAAATDLSYQIQTSLDLVDWVTVATYPPAASMKVSWTDNIAISGAGAPRRFARVHVTTP
jgi:hypothetical protein